tara:strand:+ start:3792 stop:4505 length:714 start_codon:yes stop_codon:yes gene_type:complete
MITKNEIKRIKSLRNKRDRKELKLFVVEGEKSVLDLLNADWQAESIYSLNSLLPYEVTRVTKREMERLTFLKSASTVLAVFKIPKEPEVSYEGRLVVLDGITDPGNLGTIIRLCAWFGISTILCSDDTVDCYNPKVVQASMGSLTKVNCVYRDLTPFLKNTNKPIYATLLNGKSIYETKVDAEGILVMGSESHGISEKVKIFADHQVTIPRFGSVNDVESLNVAVATAIVMGEIFRP